MTDSRELAAMAAKLDVRDLALVESMVQQLIACRVQQSGQQSVLPKVAALLVQAGKKEHEDGPHRSALPLL